MSIAFGVVGAFAAIALLIGFLRFWRDVGESYSTLAKPGALASAAKDIFTLVNLDNGGDGCSYPTEKSSESRKWFHHATFYGFLSCLIATTLGAVYYFILGQHGPPSFTSLPVIFGIVGGVGLIVGPIGLWVQMQRRNVDIVDRSQTGMELSFILLLLLISITGLLLLAQ
jgi:citrate/tricarballylate utilization protein